MEWNSRILSRALIGTFGTRSRTQSKAEWAGVKTCDVVLEVNRKSVTTVQQFQTEWRRKQEASGASRPV